MSRNKNVHLYYRMASQIEWEATVNAIPTCVLLNCILVSEGVRPAMLIQPMDYQEETGQDPRSYEIVNAVKTLFPQLQYSEDYDEYQGIIVSRENYNQQKIDLNKMGEILGYPCHAEFETLDIDDTTYGINIVAKLRNGERVFLLANVCQNKSKLPMFRDIATAAKKAFDNEIYSTLLRSPVQTVSVSVNEITSTPILIKKVSQHQPLSEADNNQILDIFYNFGYPEDFMDSWEEYFQYKNPVHRGILLSLLLQQKHDTISIFYPFTQQKLREHETIAAGLAKHTIDVLLDTRTRTSPKKTRKTRSI